MVRYTMHREDVPTFNVFADESENGMLYDVDEGFGLVQENVTTVRDLQEFGYAIDSVLCFN